MTQPESGSRYTSPFRRSQGEATRHRIVEAALSFIIEGQFRPEAKAIGARAGCDKSAVVRHFGSLPELYEHIARVHWARVIVAAEAGGFCNLPYDRKNFAWLLMTGRRP